MTNMCLSQQNMSFVTTKLCLLWQNFCHDKIMSVATQLLSQQTHVCHDKSFVSTSIWTHVCHNKIMFVTTNICCDKFCRDKNILSRQTIVFTTKLLSQQAYFYCDKRCFVATNTCLLRQISATTKMILVAAPTNDNRQGYEVPVSLNSCSLYHTVRYLWTLTVNNRCKHS